MRVTLIPCGGETVRRGRAITTYKSEYYPQHLLFLDTEARREKVSPLVEVQVFRLGYIRYIRLDPSLNITHSEGYVITTPSTIVSIIEQHARKDKTLYMYAHNIKYDLQLTGLLELLIAEGWHITKSVLEDPPTYIRLKKNRYNLMLVDTFNYWQSSVSAMGEQLGMPKLIMPDDNSSNEDWEVYCRRDVEILSEYLIQFMRFIKDNHLGGLALTLASQAFRAYRCRYMPDEIPLHDDPLVTSLEREGYRGGRVEAFRIGEIQPTPVYKLDVNSMYPYVMRNHLYPFKLVGYSENVPVSKLRKLLEEYYVIANCRVDCTHPCYPYTHNGKLVFPTGSFITTLHKPELEYGVLYDEIKHVYKIAIYTERDLFSAFVDWFYQGKLDAELRGNRVERTLYKIMMNALYGKFGQRNVVSVIVPTNTDVGFSRTTGYSEKLGTYVEVNQLGNVTEVRYKHGESYYSYPAIAGAVTAYARVYLWNLITIAGVENVFYCDTDSLIVSPQGYASLQPYIHSTRLGLLKLEGVYNSFIVFGCKDYVLDNQPVIKGVPRNAQCLAEGVWEYQQFEGIKTWLRSGGKPLVTVTTRIKRRVSTYDKRIVLPNGCTKPLCLLT